jgi:hypothetical protein
LSHPRNRVPKVSSDNVSGGDNQQETALSRQEIDASWVEGFVDGEGCFSVSVHRNPLFVVPGVGTSGQLLRCTSMMTIGRCSRSYSSSSAADPSARRVRIAEFSLTPLQPSGPGRVGDSVFERHPLRIRHRDFAAFALVVRAVRPEGASRSQRIRRTCSACLQHECQWQAEASRKYWQDPQRLHARPPQFGGRRYSPTCMATCRARQK